MTQAGNGSDRGTRLDSWKAIATFLGRTVRTVQRWERSERLPVRRLQHDAGASVYAYTQDLQRWIASRTSGVSGSAAAVSPPRAREGYFHYVRACDALRKRTRPALLVALQELEASLACDPTWAPAHAALAEAHVVMTITEWCVPAEGFPKIVEAAAAALSIDPTMAVAHAALGIEAGLGSGEWDSADAHFARAISADPRAALPHYWYGIVLMNHGRFGRAIEELEEAAALDPMAPMIVANIGRPYLCQRDYATASKYFRLALELQPGLWLGEVFLGWAHEGMGDYDRAIECLERAVRISGGEPVASTSLAHACALGGRGEAAERMLDEFLAAREVFIPPVRIARVYVGLGRRDDALEWLERAKASRSLANHTYIRYDPAFDPLSGDPRFEALLRSVNL